jgi:8-oxo-dGTP diphosphatase
VSAKLPRIRVAGVLVRGGKLLVVEHERDGRRYHLLPGGGLEWGETCAAGLAREFMEELSLQVSVGSLLVINESIAPGAKRHILNLTFAVRHSGGALKLNPDRRLKAAVWLTRAELRRAKFYPDIKKHLLRAWDIGFKVPAAMVTTPWR